MTGPGDDRGGHSILVVADHIPDRRAACHDLGEDHVHPRQQQAADRYAKRLVRQLGHKVTSNPPQPLVRVRWPGRSQRRGVVRARW